MTLPEESYARFPPFSFSFHCDMRPELVSPLLEVVPVTVRAMVVEADAPDPPAETTILYVPGAAEAEAESVRVELHVTVHVGFEKEAETPAGTDEAEYDTLTALPEVSVAVKVSDTEEPCAAEIEDELGEREIVDADTGATAVVKVKSEDSVSCPKESCEPAR